MYNREFEPDFLLVYFNLVRLPEQGLLVTLPEENLVDDFPPAIDLEQVYVIDEAESIVTEFELGMRSRSCNIEMHNACFAILIRSWLYTRFKELQGIHLSCVKGRGEEFVIIRCAAFIQNMHDGIGRGLSLYWALRLHEDEELIGTSCLWNFSSSRNSG